MDELMLEYKEIFIEESLEQIQAMNESLVALEKTPEDKIHIDTLFRVAHTLKSSCAAVGLTELSKVAHKAEDLMQKIRNHEIRVSSEIIDALFSFCDLSRLVVDNLKENRTSDIDFEASITQFRGLIEQTQTPLVGTEKEEPAQEPHTLTLTSEENGLMEAELATGKSIWKIDIEIDSREILKWLRAELILNTAKEAGNTIALRPDKKEFLLPEFSGIFSFLLATELPLGEIRNKLDLDLIKELRITPFKNAEMPLSLPPLMPLPQTDEDRIQDDSEKPDQSLPKSPLTSSQVMPQTETRKKEPVQQKTTSQQGSADSIRVSVAKLDELMNLIGELATTVSGMKQIDKILRSENPHSKALAPIANFSDKLSNLSTDLQFSIMNTRMMPISIAFQKFPRVVRDLSKATGKELELEILNPETELDKKVIDAIGEPLMHLVRNAADHGLETPSERLAAGKSAAGHITLSAQRQGNQIIVTVKDDGKGIDLDKVREKAISQGLYTSEEASILPDEILLQSLFEAGFSTAKAVTELSGRGVGLDVVKNVITSLGGNVNVRTEKGKGTEFEMVLPLTLTTTFVILTKVGANLYAIPVNDVHESLGITQEKVKTVDGKETIILRDEVLPLVCLKTVFGDGSACEESPNKRKKRYVIVATYRNHKIGFLVDRIVGTEEIVQKPLERNFRTIKGLSGVSILGDGTIVLVLDVPGLIQFIKKEKSVVQNSQVGNLVTHLKKEATRSKPVRSSQKKEVRMSKIENRNVLGLLQAAFQDAASSLSQLTGRSLKIYSSETMELMSGEDLINAYSETIESPHFCSLIKTQEGMKSNILLVISEQDGYGIFDMICGSPAGTTKTADKDVILAMGEINNILSSAFINQMANRLQRELHPSTPLNSFDMLGAVLQGAVMQEDLIGKKIMVANTVFVEEGKAQFHARLFIMTDSEEFMRLIG
jgi:two-component system chemotaxis sensor kinase CheA